MSISYNVYGAGHCCEEVGVRILATGLALPAKHGENDSFAHKFCAYKPNLTILTALESTYLVPKLVKLH